MVVKLSKSSCDFEMMGEVFHQVRPTDNEVEILDLR